MIPVSALGRRFLAASCLLAAGVFAAYAEGQAAAKEEKAFVVAVAVFESSSISPDHSLFLSALPRLVVSRLSPLPPRFEVGEYAAEKVRRKALTESFALAEGLAGSLDDLALRNLEPGLDPNRRSQSIASAKQKVEEAKARLGEASASPSPEDGGEKTGSVPSARATVLFGANQGGGLVELGGLSPSEAAREGGYDLLVTGRVEEIGNYIAVTVEGHDAALDRRVFSWKEYCSPDDPEPLASLLAERISRFVAMAPYARLDISIVPESARITVDGRELSPGTRSLFYFAPARVRVSAEAPAREAAASDLDLVLGETKELAIELAPSSAGTIQVSTLPEGLPVFLDGMPLGKSPLEASLGAERSILSAFDSEGGKALAVVSPEGAKPGSGLLLEPEPSSDKAAAALTEARRAFYDALGWFVVSLPPLSIAWGTADTLAGQAALGGGAEITARRDGAYAATAALAAGTLALATNAVLRLIRYIGAAK